MNTAQAKYVKLPSGRCLPEDEVRETLRNFVAFAHRHVPDAETAEIALRLELEEEGINRHEHRYVPVYVVEGIYVESDVRGYLNLVATVREEAKTPNYREQLPTEAIWEWYLADYENPRTVTAMSVELVEPLVEILQPDPLKVHSTLFINLANPEIHLRNKPGAR